MAIEISKMPGVCTLKDIMYPIKYKANGHPSMDRGEVRRNTLIGKEAQVNKYINGRPKPYAS